MTSEFGHIQIKTLHGVKLATAQESYSLEVLQFMTVQKARLTIPSTDLNPPVPGITLGRPNHRALELSPLDYVAHLD